MSNNWTYCLSGAPRMMLRSRNPNIVNQPTAGKPDSDHPVKRAAGKQIQDANNKENSNGGEPKPKRAALSELRNQISSVLIDSSRKPLLGKNETKERTGKRSPSTSDLAIIGEEKTALNDSVVVLEEVPGSVEVDPCPGYDYDKENIGDEFNVPEFAFDIFRYYRSREGCFPIGDYVPKQPKVSKDTRAVLVDWMIEMQETFELNHETLYLAVKLVDLHLTNTKEKVASRAQLQLIACAAVFVASKYEERQPPLIDDFLYMAEDMFTRPDLEAMERKMLVTVGFDLGAPLSYSFVRRYAKASKVDMKTLTLSRYILETSLMFYEFCRASDSKMAAGSFLLALRMLDPKAEWTPVLHKYSGLTAAEVEPWCWELSHMMHVRASGKGVNAKLNTAFQKYSHEVFFETAAVPLIEDKFPSDRAIQCPE